MALSGIAAAAIVLGGFAGTAACLALIAAAPQERVPVGLRLQDVARFLVMQASFTLVGALIVWRRPENRVGWLLSATSLFSAAQLLAAGYAVFGLLADPPLPGAHFAAWTFAWLGGVVALPLGLVAVSFPDGRPQNARTRACAALMVAAAALGSAFLAFRPGPLVNFPLAENPFGVPIPDALWVMLLVLAVLMTLGAAAFAVGLLWQRLRRSTGIEREQLKWVLSGVGGLSGAIALGLPLMFLDWEAFKNLGSVALSLIPLSIGVAILRHRLYDIDLLINRTLVYGALSAVLVVIYFAVVVVFQSVLRPFTAGNELAVAASTLATLALVQPLRRRIQGVVDRRFYRSRYDAARTLDAFGVQLRDEVDIDAVQEDLLVAVRETLQPSHTSVWLRPR